MWSLQTTACVRLGCSFTHVSFSSAAKTCRQTAFLLPRSLQLQLSLLSLCSYHWLRLKTEIFYKTRVSGHLAHFLCLSLPFFYISRPQHFREAGELRTSLSLRWFSPFLRIPLSVEEASVVMLGGSCSALCLLLCLRSLHAKGSLWQCLPAADTGIEA